MTIHSMSQVIPVKSRQNTVDLPCHLWCTKKAEKSACTSAGHRTQHTAKPLCRHRAINNQSPYTQPGTKSWEGTSPCKTSSSPQHNNDTILYTTIVRCGRHASASSSISAHASTYMGKQGSLIFYQVANHCRYKADQYGKRYRRSFQKCYCDHNYSEKSSFSWDNLCRQEKSILEVI